ncbi:MAG: hypothetical protein R3D25_13395 [Geminicoccaceae bacterium]
MTGVGGPGNATRHYGILVDEKSIGSRNMVRVRALALSGALMAVLTWPLARFMRGLMTTVRGRTDAGDRAIAGALTTVALR